MLGLALTGMVPLCGLQSWIGEVAPYVKTLTKSLVTIGQEGFYQADNCHADK